MTRTDAKRELLARASHVERCFTRTNDYRNVDEVGTACAAFPYTNPEGTYRITVSNYAAGTFTLTATPQASRRRTPSARHSPSTSLALRRHGHVLGDPAGLLGRPGEVTRGRPVWLTMTLRRAAGAAGWQKSSVRVAAARGCGRYHA